MNKNNDRLSFTSFFEQLQVSLEQIFWKVLREH